MSKRMRVLAAGLLALSLAVGAAPALGSVAYAADVESAQAGQEGATVNISTADELAKAIANQADNQVWNINADITLGEAELAQYASIGTTEGPDEAKVLTIGEWYFPIYVNGLTINGNSHTVTSSVEKANGNWNTQDFIMVAGDDVTIDNLKIVCKKEVNKAIEVIGANFTISNSKILPVDGGNSGSLYFNGGSAGAPIDLGNATVSNVTLSSWVSTSSVQEGDNVTLDGVTIDMTNNEYEGTDGFLPVRNNCVTVGDGGLTVKVDGDSSAVLEDTLNSLPAGTTLSLEGNISLPSTLNIKGLEDVTIEGNGHTITAASNFTTDEYGQLGLVKPEDCTNLTIKDVNLVATSASTHVLDVYDCKGVVLENVALDHSAAQKGSALTINGSDVAVRGAFDVTVGPNSWQGIDVDSKVEGETGKLTFDESAAPTFTNTGEKDVPYVTTTNGSVTNNNPDLALPNGDVPLHTHVGELKNDKAATTTSTGYTGDIVCTICGETLKKGEVIPKLAPGEVVMYRLYNPNSGEHFYTSSEYERDSVIKSGWDYEGVGWIAVDTGDPVYRLYNPNAGDHHYTMSAYERDSLLKAGWKDEGIGWYSADKETGVPLLREYNPNATTGTHNYTVSQYEHNYLVSIGWNDEGIAWYAVK